MEEGRSLIAACVGWYGCIRAAVGVKGSLYLLAVNTQTLQKGLWAPGVCIFETKSCPAGPGVLLFLENSDKEVVLGLTKSSIRDFLQVFCLAVHRLPGSP